MKQKKRYFKILLIIVIFTSLPFQVSASNDDYHVSANAALVVDYETGKILYNQNGDEPLGIASMTKLITAYIVYDEVDKGNISWDDTIKISDNLKKMSKNPDLSNIPIEDKHVYTVKDALYGSLISSANSLTSALAEHISGTELKFVDRMYDQLKTWGIDDATLVTASGLGNEDMGKKIYPGSKKEDENMMSARSMAIVGQQLIADFPDVLEITSLPSTTILKNSTEDGIVIWNSNGMLDGFDYYTEGVDGLKTGTTPLAGDCFIGTATRNEHRIITVVMGVDDGFNRFDETAKLMDYIYTNWSYEVIKKKGDPANTPTIDVHHGKKNKANIVLTDDLAVWTNKENKNIKSFFKPTKKQLTRKEKVAAPKNKGYLVGKEYGYNTKDNLGYLTSEDEKLDVVDVGLSEAIEKENMFMQIWHSIVKS